MLRRVVSKSYPCKDIVHCGSRARLRINVFQHAGLVWGIFVNDAESSGTSGWRESIHRIWIEDTGIRASSVRGAATTFPVSAFMTIIFWLSQAERSTVLRRA